MTVFGALHPKRDVDRVYLSRQKGRKMCMKANENNLAW